MEAGLNILLQKPQCCLCHLVAPATFPFLSLSHYKNLLSSLPHSLSTQPSVTSLHKCTLSVHTNHLFKYTLNYYTYFKSINLTDPLMIKGTMYVKGVKMIHWFQTLIPLYCGQNRLHERWSQLLNRCYGNYSVLEEEGERERGRANLFNSCLPES